MLVVKHYSLLIIVLLMASCSGEKCDFADVSKPYTSEDDFKKLSLEGVYRVSSLSTDKSFDKSALEESFLYVFLDSANDDFTSGNFYFKNYPAWDDELSKSVLENFYGNWFITTQPGGLFFKDRLDFGPFYLADFENVPARSMCAALPVRIKDGNPIIVTRVLTSHEASSKYGYSLIYHTPKSIDFCNYLVYEKVTSLVGDEIKSNTRLYLQGLLNK